MEIVENLGYQNALKKTKFKNILLKHHLDEILFEAQLNKIEVVVLKGMALIQDLYSNWGERPITDIDLFLSSNRLRDFGLILSRLGYRLNTEGSTKLDYFKQVWVKVEDDLEVVVELHTKLFWQEPESFHWEMEADEVGMVKLEKHYFLIHLIGHYAYQHTFLKAFWLNDIAKFIDKQGSQLNFQRLEELAIELGLLNAWSSTLYCVHKYFHLKNNYSRLFVSTYLKKNYRWWFRFISLSFILNPKKGLIRFLFLKYLVKGSLRSNISYTLSWLPHKFLKSSSSVN
ncbi:MAG: nucleotidyltransferase family protein [Bdellovibrionales bacterium]|nr:nucleotidyltransferase family protein [Bdellovibrionales bacterium]